MEISPLQMVRMLIASLGFGVMLGGLTNLHRVIRVMVGVEESSARLKRLYDIKIPFAGKPVSIPCLKKGRGAASFAVIAIQDIIWFLVAGAGIVIIAYTFDDGRIRIYPFWGVITGRLLYRWVMEGWFQYVLESLAVVLRIVVFAVLFLFCVPIRIIFAFFYKKMNLLLKSFQKALEKRKKKVYNQCGVNYLLSEAKKGFVP